MSFTAMLFVGGSDRVGLWSARDTRMAIARLRLPPSSPTEKNKNKKDKKNGSFSEKLAIESSASSD
jgi:hypothetical protein